MNKHILAVWIVGLALILGGHAQSSEMVVGLSPFNDKAQTQSQVKAVINYLLENAKPGDKIRFYDAYNLKSLETFQVPNNKGYTNPRAKLMVNKDAVKKLLQFAEKAQRPQGEGQPSVIGAIRAPEFLRFLGENVSINRPTNLILMGSQKYDDPSQKGFSMARGHVPGDGHLQVSVGQSPFGMSGNPELLKNIRVHWGFPGSDRPQDNSQYFIKRFWTLFIERQGGQLVTFTGDLPTLFDRVRSGARAPKHDYVLTSTTKLEMILYRPNEVKEQVSIYERPLSATPVSLTVVKKAQRVEIGISWDCAQCDLDLYAQPHPKAEILYFEYTQSREGKYWKDFRVSPSSSNSYETVSFHKPVDVSQLFLAINFFKGKVSKSVDGEIRVAIGNRTYAKKFQLKANKGNKASGIESTLKNRKAANVNWLIIDPMQVVVVRK